MSYEDFEKPWIDHTIKILIKKRQLYLKLRELGHLKTREYSKYRNCVFKRIKLTKIDYYHKIFNDVRGAIKKNGK